MIAKIPRETTKTKDITGGLPRVAELFEARKPKDYAVISEIDGWCRFGKDTKGKRKVIVTPDVGEPQEYLVTKASTWRSTRAIRSALVRLSWMVHPIRTTFCELWVRRHSLSTWWTKSRRSTDSKV